jgi:hypothetical protein
MIEQQLCLAECSSSRIVAIVCSLLVVCNYMLVILVYNCQSVSCNGTGTACLRTTVNSTALDSTAFERSTASYCSVACCVCACLDNCYHLSADAKREARRM